MFFTVAFIVIGVLAVIVGFTAFFGAPYVPSRRQDMVVLFDKLYPLTSSDVVVDLGSGDGVVLREISRRGARAYGVELHPVFYLISKWFSRRDDKVVIKLGDMWKTKLPAETTLVYMFSVGRDMKRAEKYVQQEVNRLGKDITLVSYGNGIPGRVSTRSVGAYHLYTFTTLQ